jgi:hypothetical protein
LPRGQREGSQPFLQLSCKFKLLAIAWQFDETIFEPELVLPSQWREWHRREGDDAGAVRRLALAVLVNVVSLVIDR